MKVIVDIVGIVIVNLVMVGGISDSTILHQVTVHIHILSVESTGVVCIDASASRVDCTASPRTDGLARHPGLI